jgi:hypothetical protein
VRVRDWFRFRAVQTRSIILLVNLDDVRALAAKLREVRDSRRLSEEAFRNLHSALLFHGPDETLWTVGLGSLSFSRMTDGKWMASDPPKFLFLDAEMVKALVALSSGSYEPKMADGPR